MGLAALEIYLTKHRKILMPPSGRKSAPFEAVAAFNRNLMSLGFVCSQALESSLADLTEESLGDLYKEIVPSLQKMIGGHRTFRPMYPNFPKQVMEASEFELYMNAMAHYWMAGVRDAVQGQPRLHGGALVEGAPDTPADIGTLTVPLQWLPEYAVEKREPLPSGEVTLQVIGLGSEQDFCTIFTNLIGSNGSLSESDKGIVKWFVDNKLWDIPKLLPPAIPNKENLAFLIGYVARHGTFDSLTSHLKTATDVLRVAVAMSDGDVSLAKPCKFRRFRRIERRFLLGILDGMPFDNILEDMARRPEVWKRLGRELRPGDYGSRYIRICKAFNVVRNRWSEMFETFNGGVEAAIKRKDVPAAAKLLKTRPGEFARRLDHLLRMSASGGDALLLVEEFIKVASKVSTPVLLQVHAHFHNRYRVSARRAFFPKGNVAKVMVGTGLPALLPLVTAWGPLDMTVASRVREVLVERFRTLSPLGKVYIDDSLLAQNVPFAQRSASKSLRTVARGSRLDLPSTETLRFFVWWKEPKGIRTDIDLAAVFFDADWKRLADVSYYNLRGWNSCHSGDITSAPNGAAEFIDVHVPTLYMNKVRYVAMVVYSYTQQAFKDLPECFAGWMARQKPQSGEIFEARTVQDKIDIAGDTTVNIPIFFDLENMQAVWADIALKSCGPINNSRQAGESLALMGKTVTGLVKPTLYDLFAMHAEARGIRVDSPSEADVVFSMHEGITPFDTGRIMAEFMTNGATKEDAPSNDAKPGKTPIKMKPAGRVFG